MDWTPLILYEWCREAFWKAARGWNGPLRWGGPPHAARRWSPVGSGGSALCRRDIDNDLPVLAQNNRPHRPSVLSPALLHPGGPPGCSRALLCSHAAHRSADASNVLLLHPTFRGWLAGGQDLRRRSAQNSCLRPPRFQLLLRQRNAESRQVVLWLVSDHGCISQPPVECQISPSTNNYISRGVDQQQQHQQPDTSDADTNRDTFWYPFLRVHPCTKFWGIPGRNDHSLKQTIKNSTGDFFVFLLFFYQNPSMGRQNSHTHQTCCFSIFLPPGPQCRRFFSKWVT